MQTIDAHTRVVTLLGYPIEHTLSPLLHNTAFEHQELNFIYTASPVKPSYIEDAVAGIRAMGMAGANVTIPHKERVAPLVDELTEEAAAVGAVNTIVASDDGAGGSLLTGDNTDIAGFLRPLQPYREQLTDSRVLIFGSGGAARAVVYALLTTYSPGQCTIAARSPEKAERLAGDLAPYDAKDSLTVVSLDDAGPSIRSSRLLVNATPVGMHPNTGQTVWPRSDDFHPGQIAYDLVYRPRTTKWLTDAADRGAETIAGLQMLIAQAAAAYVQWTGKSMPVTPVETAVTNQWGP